MTPFDSDYFTAAYGDDYERRNPPYKWRSFLNGLLRYRVSGDLLEVGCGFGLFLREAMPFFNCMGCDISAYAVAQARRRLPAQIPLFCGAVGQLPVTGSFDVVAAFDVLEHIPNLRWAFSDFARLLRPHGLLLFTVPVYDGPLGWLVNRLDHDTTHVHRRGRDFWLQQISPQFSLQHCAGIWRYFLWGKFYLNKVSRFARRWTTAILVIAAKQ